MASDNLTISVVIPLYNGGRFIEEALNSVLAQTLPPNEIIVVNDGSTDDGPARVAAMAQTHPITLMHKANGGQSSARNFGIAHSTGTLIALLDQDDAWYPHHLEVLIKPFRRPRSPELGWVYSNLDEVNLNGQMMGRSCLRHALGVVHPKRDLIDCLKSDMFILPSSSLMRRTAFDNVGRFDERLQGFEDDDLFLRMFRAGYENFYIDRALTRWRVFSESSSFSARMAVSRMIYVRKLLDEYPDDPIRMQHYTRDLIVPRFFPWLVREYTNAMKAGQWDGAKTALEDMRFMMPMQRPRIRLIMRLLMPILEKPSVARTLYPLVTAIRPALRRLLR